MGQGIAGVPVHPALLNGARIAGQPERLYANYTNVTINGRNSPESSRPVYIKPLEWKSNSTHEREVVSWSSAGSTASRMNAQPPSPWVRVLEYLREETSRQVELYQGAGKERRNEEKPGAALRLDGTNEYHRPEDGIAGELKAVRDQTKAFELAIALEPLEQDEASKSKKH